MNTTKRMLEIHELDAKLVWLASINTTDPNLKQRLSNGIKLPDGLKRVFGEQQLADKISDAGFPCQKSKINNWRQTGRIPLDEAVVVAEIFGFGPPEGQNAQDYWDRHWPAWYCYDPDASGQRRDTLEAFQRHYLTNAFAQESGDGESLSTALSEEERLLLDEAEALLSIVDDKAVNTRCVKTRLIRCLGKLVSEIGIEDDLERRERLLERHRVIERIRRSVDEPILNRLTDDLGLNSLLGRFVELTSEVEIESRESGQSISNTYDTAEGRISEAIEELLSKIDEVTDQLERSSLAHHDKKRVRTTLEAIEETVLLEQLDLDHLQKLRQEIELLRDVLNGLDRIVRQIEVVAGCVPDGHKRHGDIFRDHLMAPAMVVIDPPEKTFQMGSPADEAGHRVSEGPQHLVEINSKFALGRYTVTFEEYEAYCRAMDIDLPPDDEGWGRGRRSVIDVNWDDAQKYLAWLNGELGLGDGTYRLPSEAAWEFACRAGTQTRYAFGDELTNEMANIGDSSNGKTVEVGSYPSNGWGLHDTHGNVWEWCADPWHETYEGAPDDGSIWLKGGDERLRVLRGGSWSSIPEDLRSANRVRDSAGNRDSLYGFRVARTLRE